MVLVAPWHVGSSRTRAQTHVPCIGRWILNHCATREVPERTFLEPLLGASQVADTSRTLWHWVFSAGDGIYDSLFTEEETEGLRGPQCLPVFPQVWWAGIWTWLLASSALDLAINLVKHVLPRGGVESGGHRLAEQGCAAQSTASRLRWCLSGDWGRTFTQRHPDSLGSWHYVYRNIILSTPSADHCHWPWVRVCETTVRFRKAVTVSGMVC